MLLPIDSSRAVLPSVGIGIVEGEAAQEQASAPAENGNRETASAIAPRCARIDPAAGGGDPRQNAHPAPYPEECSSAIKLKISRDR